MKIHAPTLTFILILAICPTAFSQKCKEKLPKIAMLTNSGSPKITRKPQPQYTEEARRRNIAGTVLLRGTFHSSGKVKDVCWVKSLSYGLTENAIKAAYRIVFEPITKDGKPASVRIFIEYNFNLY